MSGPSQPAACDQVEPTTLITGQFVVTDASRVTCVRIPGAGAAGAEYLYVAVSAAANESSAGTSTPYRLVGKDEGGVATATAGRAGPVPASLQLSPARRFHDRLRVLERKLARSPPATSPRTGALAAAAPALGDTRTFSVLRSADASGSSSGDYVPVNATAKFAGRTVSIYLDDAAPIGGGYTQADIDAIGALFEDQLYPIDTTAFGRESDVNGDGQVLVLLTDRVTRLAGCGSGEVVVGFFYAVDLHPELTGSNGAEVFYGLVPDPSCGVDRSRATELLPGVFIHEFQHMINYNQHALVRHGDAEDTWLNEGLSMFAQELGGRQVPNARCAGNDCLNQFALDDFTNAYDFLHGVESHYLIGPSRPPLPLTAYGAAWLFVRWLGDHFATTQPLATDLTRKLVQTSRTGAANVEAASGQPFATLVAEWQLANYADDLPGIGSADSLLQYPSWRFRDIFAAFHAADPGQFPLPYPLAPDSTNGAYEISGSLPAGSGKHLLIRQSGGSPPLAFTVTEPTGGSALPESAAPRWCLLRLR
jgi:hypothetical protein